MALKMSGEGSRVAAGPGQASGNGRWGRAHGSRIRKLGFRMVRMGIPFGSEWSEWESHSETRFPNGPNGNPIRIRMVRMGIPFGN